jgi:2Fe-2S ferredoxin
MHFASVLDKPEFAIAAKTMTLNVRMPDGGWLSPPAEPGVRVMDLTAWFGIPVRQECRGLCVRATCRARVAAPWGERLEPPDSTELEVLSLITAHDDRTRLLCGLIMTPDLDGLELELTWDALVPQTYWVAG